ncbi:MAG: hypothetical protein EOO27_37670 [Comamonadaceae bacterium]|nr:MAG: hypothetical protein EOO27_37670 [Comamonadaceae bacterium]
MPDTTLRPIALHVDEPHQGDFVWVLIERKSPQSWTEIDRATSAARTYKEAMADGLGALQAMVDDLDVGPRQTVRGAAKPAEGSADDSDADDVAAAVQPARAKPFFGFGPAR